jgi:transposase-like protein
MSRRAYPAEFRRKVLDLLAAGRKVEDVAGDLDVSDQTIYNWRRQDLIDRGLLQGLTTDGNVELAAAKKRVAALEDELRATKRAMGAGPRSGGPKARYAAIKQMAAEGHVVQMCCRILDVAESGYYDWLKRPPSPQAVRHALLIAVIREVHAASRGTYGVRRAPAELRLGRNLTVGHGQVEALMANARLKGVAGRPKWRRSAPDSRALDLVNRHSAATGSTRYGSQTSPNTRPVRARSIALPCWTPTPAGSSDGRSTLHRTLPW